MEGHSLPHGATGIEGDDFAIEFRGDKIVFAAKSAGPAKHYTLEAGFKTGVIDLHETQDVSDGQERHRTLFAMRRDELAALLGVASPMIPELLILLRPLRLGWLKHRDIGIARGIDLVSDDDIAAVTRKHKRRLALDAELYRQNLFFPEYLEDVYDFPDGNFTLIHRGRNIGMGFKQTDAAGNIRLFWIKRRDLMRFGNKWQATFGRAIADIAIPSEDYPQYPFLRP